MAEKTIERWFKTKLTEADTDKFIKYGKNVIAMGRKGVGKTALFRAAFEKHFPKQHLIFSAATMDPLLDLYGIPREQSDKVGVFLDYVLPKIIRDTDVKAIFVDEMNRGDKRITNALFELSQFGTINNRPVSKTGKTLVWAAINPTDHDEDTYHTEELDSALADRFDIRVEIPYELDSDYFYNKYPQYAEGAIEWWNALPEKNKTMVSPRRLDKALEILNQSGEAQLMRFVISPDCNIEKLITYTIQGSLTKNAEALLSAGKSDELAKFLKKPNIIDDLEIQKLILRKKSDYIPLLNEERLISIMSKYQEVQDFVFDPKNPQKKIIELLTKSQNAQYRNLAQQYSDRKDIENASIGDILKRFEEINKKLKV